MMEEKPMTYTENPMVEVNNLKKYFKTKRGMLHAVDDVSFTIKKGETLGLVGESGCGKSTLGRVMIRLLEPTDGEIKFYGEDIVKYSLGKMKSMRRKLQIVFQDPYSSLNPRLSVSDLIAEPLLVNRVYSSTEERQKKIRELMDTVGLARRLVNAYPHELDGGRRQRIGIARSLALSPEFIVLDEPVSALDVCIQAQILNLMMDLQQDLGLSYVFISHDLSVVGHIADEVMVMYLGRCVEKGSKDAIFNNPRHPYTQALLSATPRLNPDMRRERIKLTGELPSPLNPPPGCAFNARCRRAFGTCTQLQPQLKQYGDQQVACFAVDQDENEVPTA